MINLRPEQISWLCALLEFARVHHIQLNGESQVEFLGHCRAAYYLDNGLHFSIPPEQAGNVLIVGHPNRLFLEELQQVRYPWIGVWCVIECMEDENEDISPLCDSFLLETSAHDVHVVKRTRCVTAFTLQPSGNVCNKAGISEGSISTQLTGQALLLASQSADLYTTARKNASQISKHAVGVVEGFERALIYTLSRSLNFSLVWKTEYHLPFGIRPLKGILWNNTILGALLRREVHMIFGDFSLLHPREVFCDFTYPHDGDSASFMSLVKTRPLNLWSIIQLTGYMTVFLYFASSIAVGCLCHFKETSSEGKESFTRGSHILHAILLICCQQQKDLGKSRFWFPLVHRICVFFLGAMFSSGLVNIIANPDIEGKLDELDEILDAASRKNAHLIGNIQFYNNLMNSPDNPRLKRIAARLEKCGNIQDCSDKLFSENSSAFLLAEGLHHAREIWARNAEGTAHISAEKFYNLFQAFGVQKGCAFRDELTQKIDQLVECGMLERFKAHAGLHLNNKIVVAPVRQPIELMAIREVFVAIFSGELTAALVLCAEAILSRITESLTTN